MSRKTEIVIEEAAPTPNFIAIAYLRMSKLRHLAAHPFAPATAKCQMSMSCYRGSDRHREVVPEN